MRGFPLLTPSLSGPGLVSEKGADRSGRVGSGTGGQVCPDGMGHRRIAAAGPENIPHLSKERRMTTVYVIGGIVSAGLFVYLLVALLKPEVFS